MSTLGRLHEHALPQDLFFKLLCMPMNMFTPQSKQINKYTSICIYKCKPCFQQYTFVFYIFHMNCFFCLYQSNIETIGNRKLYYVIYMMNHNSNAKYKSQYVTSALSFTSFYMILRSLIENILKRITSIQNLEYTEFKYRLPWSGYFLASLADLSTLCKHVYFLVAV